MNYVTTQKIETQGNYPKFSLGFSKKASSVTQWFMVDGKLVCKWLMD